MSETVQQTAFSDQLQALRQRADRTLLDFIAPLPFNEGNMVAAMRHGALLGGKRLRPFLVYTTGQMFGVSLNNLDAPAAAVECIHAYSLIHDDLPAMDDDDLRRGQPTCHIKFGEANAILAGDALQTLAFTILADADMPDVALRDRLAMVSELATASGVAGMCGGQSLDLEAEDKQIGLEALEQIHRHKTGALIRAAVRLGALAAGEPGRKALPQLDRYAAAIGLAFQVQDDILDVVGETEKSVNARGRTSNTERAPIQLCSGLTARKQKRGISIRKL
ncbi:(2E,6E)-farnesyl diphosphate synthase [Serratia liquefaciens]|uniref:(2E,6E)-farnesyl diphosphate synthase n=1 Tax=Serratia liquefaciens TaxID=614 RepID=UPI00311A9FDE